LEVNPSFIKAIASAIILGSEGSGGSGENNKTKNYYGWLVVIEIMIKRNQYIILDRL
jgi:hypothetical protein